VFKNAAFNPLSCLIKAKKPVAEWHIRTYMSVDMLPRGPPLPSHHKNFFIAHWVSPPPGLVEVNFDGSCSGSISMGGYLLRDWMGRLLRAGTGNYGAISIIVAEARAMRDGILLAIQAGFQHILVEGDNKLVIQAAVGASRAPWHIHQILQDINNRRSMGIKITFKHIYHEANRAADWLARFGHSISHSFSTDLYFSPELKCIISEDAVRRSFVRNDA